MVQNGIDARNVFNPLTIAQEENHISVNSSRRPELEAP